MADVCIVIADDHASVRESLARYLNGEPGLRVVGEACDGRDALRVVALHAPDVLLLDLSMPMLSGIEVLQQLRGQPHAPRVVVLTMHNTPSYVEAALREGAWDYVAKEASTSHVVQAIRRAHAGVRPVGLAQPSDLSAADACATAAERVATRLALGLSARELEVLTLIAHGYTSKEMAARLQVSKATVDTYRMRIADKVGVRGRAELVRIAVRAGLLLPGEPS